MTENTPEETPAFDLAATLKSADMAVVSAEALSAHQKTYAPRERSKEQKAVDKLVKSAYDAWVKAGKPEKFAQSPGGRLTVPVGDPETKVRRMLTNSAAFLGVSVRHGEAKKSEVDGTELVTLAFRVVDRTDRSGASEAEASASE